MKKIFVLIGLLCGMVDYSFAGEKTMCGITCDKTHRNNSILKDSKLFYCDGAEWGRRGDFTDAHDGGYRSVDVSYYNEVCKYLDPQTRNGIFNVENVVDFEYENEVGDWSIFMTKKLKECEAFDDNTDFYCVGCASGYYFAYYDGEAICTKNKELAWCGMRISQEVEVEWQGNYKTGKCVCTGENAGKVWIEQIQNCGDENLKNAFADIDEFMESSKSGRLSVWKNADGGFNTSRLASDATAGVILGTVGGVVSAKVIKKKQIEKGFDALNCTVDGQKVAGWGDEFSVGFGK